MVMYPEVYDADNPEGYKADLKKAFDAGSDSTLESIVDITKGE